MRIFRHIQESAFSDWGKTIGQSLHETDILQIEDQVQQIEQIMNMYGHDIKRLVFTYMKAEKDRNQPPPMDIKNTEQIISIQEIEHITITQVDYKFVGDRSEIWLTIENRKGKDKGDYSSLPLPFASYLARGALSNPSFL